MVYILDAAEELKVMTLSSDYGKHLLGVEDLLQKHSLVEADINVLGDRVKTVATVSIQKHIRLILIYYRMWEKIRKMKLLKIF